MSEHVKTELVDGILVLTLQRPDKKNALTGAMYDALSDGLERAETDGTIKVVLFQGMATVSPQAMISQILPYRPKATATRKVRPFASSKTSARPQSR